MQATEGLPTISLPSARKFRCSPMVSNSSSHVCLVWDSSVLPRHKQLSHAQLAVTEYNFHLHFLTQPRYLSHILWLRPLQLVT